MGRKGPRAHRHKVLNPKPKALTRRRQQQAEAVIVEFAQREFTYFTSVPERPPGATTGGKPTADWSAADELLHRSASSLCDVRHGAGAVWLARGVAVNKSGHEGAPHSITLPIHTGALRVG